MQGNDILGEGVVTEGKRDRALTEPRHQRQPPAAAGKILVLVVHALQDLTQQRFQTGIRSETGTPGFIIPLKCLDI